MQLAGSRCLYKARRAHLTNAVARNQMQISVTAEVHKIYTVYLRLRKTIRQLIKPEQYRYFKEK